MSKRLLSSLTLATSLVALGCQSATLEAAPLASNQQGARNLVVNGAYVYWSMPDGSIRRVSIDGGKVETVVSGLKIALQLTVDDNNVYFSLDDGALGSVPKTGGTPKVLAESRSPTAGIASDGAQLFFAEAGGSVSRVATDGGKVDTIVVSAGQPTSLALQDESLLWTSNTGTTQGGAIRTAASDATKSTEMAIVSGLTSPQLLNVATRQMFWVGIDPNAVASTPDGPIAAQVVATAGLDGANVRQLTNNLSGVSSLVADDDNAYAAAADLSTATMTNGKTFVSRSQILAIDGSSGAQQQIAFTTKEASAASVAIDSTSIYWVFETTGEISAQSKQTSVSAPQ